MSSTTSIGSQHAIFQMMGTLSVVGVIPKYFVFSPKSIYHFAFSFFI